MAVGKTAFNTLLGITTLGIAPAIQSANAAKKAQEDQARMAREQDDQLQAQIKEQADRASQLRQQQADESGTGPAATRQRKRAASASGRADTILTGSLGLLDEPNAPRKTLLGI